MSGLNAEWAIDKLEDFIRATDTQYVRGGYLKYQTEEPESEVVQKAQIVEQILDRVTPKWRSLNVATTFEKWALHHEAALRAKESLLRQEELRQNLGENAP